MSGGPESRGGRTAPPGVTPDDHWSHGGHGPAALNQPADVPDHIPGRVPHRDSRPYRALAAAASPGAPAAPSGDRGRPGREPGTAGMPGRYLVRRTFGCTFTPSTFIYQAPITPGRMLTPGASLRPPE